MIISTCANHNFTTLNCEFILTCKVNILQSYLRIMMHHLAKRILVVLLAIFVTVGMGLPVVQASTMPLTIMNMSSEMKISSAMSMSGPKNCPDCGKMGNGKTMPSCVASPCNALVAFLNTPIEDINLVFNSVHRLDQTRAPGGAGSEPAPYPPRTADIG